MFGGSAEIALEIESSVKNYISLKTMISFLTGVLVAIILMQQLGPHRTTLSPSSNDVDFVLRHHDKIELHHTLQIVVHLLCAEALACTLLTDTPQYVPFFNLLLIIPPRFVKGRKKRLAPAWDGE
jgi:hypothetical protein